MSTANEHFFRDQQPITVAPATEKAPRPEAFTFPFRVDFQSLQWSEPVQSGAPGHGTESGLPKPYRIERVAEQEVDMAGQRLRLKLTTFETRNAKGGLTAQSFAIEVYNSMGNCAAEGTAYVPMNDKVYAAELVIAPPALKDQTLDPTIVTGLYANLIRALPELARITGQTIQHTEKLDRHEPGLDEEHLESLLDAAGYKKAAGRPAGGSGYVIPAKMSRDYEPR